LNANFTGYFYAFEKNNKDMELTRYGDIIKENRLKWGKESMKSGDESNLNAKC